MKKMPLSFSKLKKWSSYDLLYVVMYFWGLALNGGDEKNNINAIPSIFMNSDVEKTWISLIGWHHKTSNIHVCNAARLQEIRKDLKFQELRHGNRLLFEALWKKNKKELFWKALDTKVTFAVNEVKNHCSARARNQWTLSSKKRERKNG